MIDALRAAWTLDGAVGTALLDGSADPSDPEAVVERRPERVRALHQSMLDAGAGAVTAASFAAPRLGAAGAQRVRSAVEAARSVEPPLVLAALGPGENHAELADVALDAGADAVVLETFVDVTALVAATVAVRSAIGAGTLLAGFCPLDDLVDRSLPRRLTDAGADALLLVCGDGEGSVVRWARALAPGPMPVVARPSAGVPGARRGAAEFGELAHSLREVGVVAMGGCCGATPAHVAAIAGAR